MGGPSRESYLAAKAREEKRLAAMRTRSGVVDLAEWRAALSAARAAEKLLGSEEWFLGARLRPAPEVGFELVVTILWDEQAARWCIPVKVNDVPVRVVSRDRGRSAPAVSAPPAPSKS